MSPEQQKAFDAWWPRPESLWVDDAFEAGWNARPDAWHDAVLAECARIESCYWTADPEKTLHALIDWHVSNAKAPVSVEVGELRDALQELFEAYCAVMGSEFDYPGRPWTPERDHDHAALKAQAALAARPAPQVAQAAPVEPVDEHDCETCEGKGTIDMRLTAYSDSDPKAKCPDCDGKGWLRASPAPTPSPEAVSESERLRNALQRVADIPREPSNRSDAGTWVAMQKTALAALKSQTAPVQAPEAGSELIALRDEVAGLRKQVKSQLETMFRMQQHAAPPEAAAPSAVQQVEHAKSTIHTAAESWPKSEHRVVTVKHRISPPPPAPPAPTDAQCDALWVDLSALSCRFVDDEKLTTKEYDNRRRALIRAAFTGETA